MEEERATRDSWQILPMPESRSALPLRRTFDGEAYERLGKGHIPEEMEDKWFIYMESDWLYFHRSWTGYCIFQCHLRKQGDRYEVDQAWVNRDRSQYGSTDEARGLELLSDGLIDGLLLHSWHY